MRALLYLLMVALLGSLAPCQSKTATLELEDGTRITGLVKSLDKEALVLVVGDVETTYSTATITRCVFEDVADDGAVPRIEQPANGEAVAAPVSRPAAPSSRHVGRGRQLWDARMGTLDRRFPWLFPAEPMQWISIGVMLFALMSLAVHFAARIAATEHLGFGRGTVLGGWFLLVGVAQVAMVPGTPGNLIGIVAANSIVALLLFRLFYGLGFGAGVIALVMLGVQGGIGYALLLLVDATLRSIGNTTF